MLEATYEYDVFGNRVEKDVTVGVTTTTTKFAVDGWNPAKPTPVGNENFDVWADLTAGGSLAARYLRGDTVDQLLGRVDDVSSTMTPYWHLTDHLGSVRDILDDDGNVVDSLRYDSFGNIDTGTELNDAYRGRYGWTGREIDVETGLQYNRARYYDATTGRWISQDPMGFDAGDSNLYRYVRNAPVSHRDPSGFIQQPEGPAPDDSAEAKEFRTKTMDRFLESKSATTFYTDVVSFLKDRNIGGLPIMAYKKLPGGASAAVTPTNQNGKEGRAILIDFLSPQLGKDVDRMISKILIETLNAKMTATKDYKDFIADAFAGKVSRLDYVVGIEKFEYDNALEADRIAKAAIQDTEARAKVVKNAIPWGINTRDFRWVTTFDAYMTRVIDPTYPHAQQYAKGWDEVLAKAWKANNANAGKDIDVAERMETKKLEDKTKAAVIKALVERKK